MMRPPPTDGNPNQGLEETWTDLQSHFELSRGFSLIYLFFSGISTAALFKERIEGLFLNHTPPLQTLSSPDPILLMEQTLEFIRRPQALQPATESPVWIEAVGGTGDEWDRGRDILLARINEQRDKLRKSVKRPVIIALPGGFQRRAHADGPDLWSVRDLALEVEENATTGPTIFISYAHADEVWRDRIIKVLAPLGREFRFEVWSDQRIGSGAAWLPEVRAAIQKASAALFLVSPDFLDADFIMKEEVPPLLRRREEEGIPLVPIILRPCPWKEIGWLSAIQVMPAGGVPLSSLSDPEWETQLAKISKEIAGNFKPVALFHRKTGDRPTSTPFHAMPPRVSLAKLPSTSPDLFGRKEELEMLDKAWKSSPVNLVSLVAFGGVGKTALVNRWLLKMGKDNYRGAERVLGYSFYSQGTGEGRQASADEFIRFALEWFGDPLPEKGSPWEKGERLAELVKNKKNLLILDGVEPLQYPPGPMEGRLKDPGLQALVRELARHNPGLCVLSTRIAVDDLKDFEGHSAWKKDLENLSQEAGGEFLKSLGVDGSQGDLEKAAEEMKGHALALALLGGYLRDLHGGDIRKRDRIPCLEKDPNRGGHAVRVMDAYASWFRGKAEEEWLLVLGLFDRPAEPEALKVLLSAPAIRGLTERLSPLSEEEQRLALRNLFRARLAVEGEGLDAHPLVREHFGDILEKERPEAWREAHGRLYDHYKKSAKELPDTLEEMEPLFLAVSHGCRAGRTPKVFEEVFRKRISRGDQDFCLHQLGAFGSYLSALASFFETPWVRPSGEFSSEEQAFVLSNAGFALHAIGWLREAAQPMEAGLRAYVEEEDWENATVCAANLSQFFLTLGEVRRAVEFGRSTVELADKSQVDFQKTTKRTDLANALLQWGRMGEAETLFVEAERMQKERQPQYPCLYSLSGYWYCNLLLETWRAGEARERGEKELEIAQQKLWPRDIALVHLTLGRAWFLDSLKSEKGDFSKAEEYLNRAVEGLRKAGAQHHIPRSLLAQAALWRAKGEFPRAERDLDEAEEIADRGEMRLLLADAALERARMYLVMGEKEKALENLERGRKLVEETEYHRRDGEVKELEEGLADG